MHSKYIASNDKTEYYTQNKNIAKKTLNQLESFRFCTRGDRMNVRTRGWGGVL